MQQRSSILAEIGWLAYFLAVFVVCVLLVHFYVVPHHFNEVVGIMLAGIVAGLVMIATRARTRGTGRG